MTQATVESHSHDHDVQIDLSGEVDLANASDVEAALRSAVSNHSKTVTLDLTNVEYIDSAGLRIIASLATRLRRSQIELTIVAPPRSPARLVFELSGLMTIATIEPADDADAADANATDDGDGDSGPTDPHEG